MKERKIYVVGESTNYADPYQGKIVHSMDEANIVLFTGGEDVTPHLYNAEKHPTTYCNLQRDIFEKEEFDRAILSPSVKLILGVCRGSQFLCVMNGGRLIQNVNKHALGGTHTIINKEGVVHSITSTHHQMQYPYNLPIEKYELLFWSEETRGTRHEGDKTAWKDGMKEPEIVLYQSLNNKKSLAIQGHPEMMLLDSPVIKEVNNIIDSLI